MIRTSPLKAQVDAVLDFAARLDAAYKRKQRRAKSEDKAPDKSQDFVHQLLVQGMILIYAGLQHTEGDARWVLLRRMGVEHLSTWLK